MSVKPRPVADRFWEKVVKGQLDECWEWQAGRYQCSGYGQFDRRGAHRVSWELANGSIPVGMFVLHRCDNPPCVRPDHLFLGTQSDNIRDMVQKRRHDGFRRCGERSPLAKLSDVQVRSVFSDHQAGLTQIQIARSLGVHPSMVSLILSGKRRAKGSAA